MAWRWEDEVQVASQGQLVVKSSPLFGRFYVANSAIPVSAVVLRDADPLLLSKTESSSTLLDNFETESSPVLTDLFSRAYCPESISLAAALLRHSARGVDAPASATSDSDAALRSYVSVRRSTVDLLEIIAFLCARDAAWAEQERHRLLCALHTQLFRILQGTSLLLLPPPPPLPAPPTDYAAVASLLCQVLRITESELCARTALSEQALSRLLAVCDANMAGTDAAGGCDGAALWLHACLLNHACLPTAILITAGKRLTVRALATLQPGTHVTIAYLDAVQSRAERALALAHQYAFRCRCVLCAARVDCFRAFRCSGCSNTAAAVAAQRTWQQSVSSLPFLSLTRAVVWEQCVRRLSGALPAPGACYGPCQPDCDSDSAADSAVVSDTETATRIPDEHRALTEALQRLEPWLCDTCGSRTPSQRECECVEGELAALALVYARTTADHTDITALLPPLQSPQMQQQQQQQQQCDRIVDCLHESHHTVLRLCAAFCKSEVSQLPADRQTDTPLPCALGGGFVLCVAAALFRPPGLPPATLATLQGSVCAAIETVLLLRCACVYCHAAAALVRMCGVLRVLAPFSEEGYAAVSAAADCVRAAHRASVGVSVARPSIFHGGPAPGAVSAQTHAAVNVSLDALYVALSVVRDRVLAFSAASDDGAS